MGHACRANKAQHEQRRKKTNEMSERCTQFYNEWYLSIFDFMFKSLNFMEMNGIPVGKGEEQHFLPCFELQNTLILLTDKMIEKNQNYKTKTHFPNRMHTKSHSSDVNINFARVFSLIFACYILHCSYFACKMLPSYIFAQLSMDFFFHFVRFGFLWFEPTEMIDNEFVPSVQLMISWNENIYSKI